MVRTAWILELGFAVTGFLMTLTFSHIFPVFTTTRTAERFRVPGEIFYIRKMVLVEVERAGVVAM